MRRRGDAGETAVTGRRDRRRTGGEPTAGTAGRRRTGRYDRGMLRIRAVREMLIDEVASVRVVRPGRGEEGAGEAAAGAGIAGADTAVEREREALAGARRRAVLMIAFDAAAIAVLFALRDPAAPFLPLGPQVETVFTLGVLAVAVHLGLRLGQYLTYRNVARVWEELLEREG